jgi:hypothetical protein
VVQLKLTQLLRARSLRPLVKRRAIGIDHEKKFRASMAIEPPTLFITINARNGAPWLRKTAGRTLVAVVVPLVPIAFGVPTMFVFVPPSMTLTPATFAGGVQLATFMIGLSAMASMSLDRFVKIVLPMRDTLLASIHAFGVQPRCCGEEQSRHQCSGWKNGFHCGTKLIHGSPLIQWFHQSVASMLNDVQGL